MTDRELLEAAARAAGIDGWWEQTYFSFIKRTGGPWNPLTDDADAFRLAVKLNLLIDNDYNCGVGVGSASFEEVWEDKSNDPYAATRRAVVRAAAQIGGKQ